MKKLIIILTVLITVFVDAKASPIEDAVYENSEIIQAAQNSELINDLVPDFDFKYLTAEILSGTVFKPKEILSQFLGIFADEILLNIHIMGLIIIISVIWGIISNLQGAYLSKGISETAFYAFYSVYMGLILKGIKECAELAADVISDQVIFLKAAVPVYSSFMISSGQVSAATGLETIFLWFIQLIGSLIEKFAVPVMVWISVLNMVNCITARYNVKKLIDFTKQIIRWGLGILMTFFIGILGMTGLTAKSADNLGLKTLKYAVGNFVPIVGGFLSDSVTTVLTSISVLKNALGIAGVITIVLICAAPIIKMIVMIFIYKLTAGIIEPLTDARITNMVSEGAETVTFLFSVCAIVTVMFVLGITILISVGGTSLR